MSARHQVRIDDLARQAERTAWEKTDRMFAALLLFQWLAGIAAAKWISPLTWAGTQSSTHVHLWAAIFLGGAIIALPLWLVYRRAGSPLTRHTIAVAEMLYSALLIHLTGGRIETHFQIFGALAFLSFYRDWRVLATGSAVIAADHFLRGIYWPESVYGVTTGAEWRWLEHAGWVIYIDVFLAYCCFRSRKELWEIVARQAQLERTNEIVEQTVADRTKQLSDRTHELERAYESKQAIVETALDAVVNIDIDGVVTAWNSQAQRTFGWTPQEAAGRRLSELVIPPALRPLHEEGLKKFRESGAGAVLNQRIEVQALHRDGHEFPVELAITAIGGGEQLSFCAFARDITERRQAADLLSRAKDAAEAANCAKSEFLANMSHEIRTPMNGVLGMTELLLDTELTADQRDSIEMVKSSAEALMRVINDILDFSKIEAGRFDLDPVEFELREVVGDTLKALALRAHRKGLELTYDVAPDVPERLIGDAGRLRQVLMNLVGNSIKFTERGDVVVRIVPSTQTSEGCQLQFSVSDTGIGIAPEKLSLIFDPFAQADGSTTRRYGGTGLGLTISSRIVKLMGGNIQAESEPGKGSVFTFVARFDAPQTPREQSSAARPVKLRGLTVLVVDDNATNRRVLSGLLKLWDMRPTTVESGPAAIVELRRALTAGKPYPLMLTDAMMPEMDGFALVEEIRKQPGLAPATIMMLTSADRQHDAARCRSMRIAGYLVKPVKADELQIAIIAAASGTLTGNAARRSIEAPAEPSAVSRAQRSLRVLLAEDNPVNQRVAVHLLEKAGHSVVAVGSGKQAIGALGRETFDLVLMDVQMPELDGFEATRAIRAYERRTGGHTPIVAMTAHAMKGDRERCLEAGMDAYVSKPVQPSEVLRVIDSIVSQAVPGSPQPASDAKADLVFDPHAALERVDGDEEFLIEMIRLFLADVPSRIDAIRSAVAERNARGLETAAHAFKGSVSCLGAAATAAAAQRLEEMGKDADFSKVPEVFAELERELGRLRTAISEFLLEGTVVTT
jgi:two-component system, sensor histidine kinase and response regulator